MSDGTKDGGDISSGFGESRVDGPVSDEKAEKMLHGDGTDAPDTSVSTFAVDSEGTVSPEDDEKDRPEAGGGGGGGGW